VPDALSCFCPAPAQPAKSERIIIERIHAAAIFLLTLLTLLILFTSFCQRTFPDDTTLILVPVTIKNQ